MRRHPRETARACFPRKRAHQQAGAAAQQPNRAVAIGGAVAVGTAENIRQNLTAHGERHQPPATGPSTLMVRLRRQPTARSRPPAAAQRMRQVETQISIQAD